MMRIALGALAGSLLLAAPEPALHYTSSLTITTPAVDGVAPAWSQTICWTVSGFGSRAVISSPTESTIELIVAASGDFVVADMAAKTYWRIAAKELVAIESIVRPKVEMTASGESRTIAGFVSERFSFTSHFTITDESELLSLLPRGAGGFAIRGNVWLPARILDSYARFAEKAADADPMLRLSGLAPLLRGRLPVAAQYDFEGMVVEQQVTSIRLGEAGPTQFVVPTSFKELPPPYRAKAPSNDSESTSAQELVHYRHREGNLWTQPLISYRGEW
jgi:hypothetical protein